MINHDFTNKLHPSLGSLARFHRFLDEGIGFGEDTGWMKKMSDQIEAVRGGTIQ